MYFCFTFDAVCQQQIDYSKINKISSFLDNSTPKNDFNLQDLLFQECQHIDTLNLHFKKKSSYARHHYTTQILTLLKAKQLLRDLIFDTVYTRFSQKWTIRILKHNFRKLRIKYTECFGVNYRTQLGNEVQNKGI